MLRIRWCRVISTIGVLSIVVVALVVSSLRASRAADTVTSGCPTTLLLETTDDRHYIGVFSARNPMTVGVAMSLYTADQTYELAQGGLAIVRPDHSAGVSRFRSTPLIILNPDKRPFLGASINYITTDGSGTCTDRRVIESATATRDMIGFGPFLELRRAIASELKSVPTMTTPEHASHPTSATCDRPFANASIDRLVEPDYPIAARSAGATGAMFVLVTLDDTGSVTGARVSQSSGNSFLDNAGLYAAQHTTYKPDRFLCKNESGSYIFEAEWSGSRQ